MNWHSLATRFLGAILLTALTVSAVAGILVSLTFWRDLERQQFSGLSDYMAERSQLASLRFERVEAAHRAARQSLERRLPLLEDDRQVEARFDTLFPIRADGTRRSIDPLFGGYGDEEGDYHYGVAAYFNPQEPADTDRQRLLLSAYHVVDRAGEALQGQIDNIYFFTPTNELVISAANRPDQLMFYRRDASPDFDLTRAAFADLVSPQNNPDGDFVCGELTRLIYVRDREVLTSGCFSPVWQDGQYLGTFGTTAQLDEYFSQILANPPRHGLNLIIDREGRLIAHLDLLGRPATPDLVERLENDLALDAVSAAIARQPQDKGIFITPDSQWVAAFATLHGPDWSLVTLVDRSVLQAETLSSMLLVLGFGMLGVGIQGALIYMIFFRRVIQPLHALTKRYGQGPLDVEVANQQITGALLSKDELGTLARTLERQRLESAELLDILEDRVKQRTAQLEAANRSKSEFLANMSHELRTPLNGILGLAQILEKALENPAQQNQAQMIFRSGNALALLLNDILDMSKIEAGKLALAPSETDFVQLVGDVDALFAPAAREKGIEFTVCIDPDVPRTLQIDALRVRQCLSNLLSNAVKFTNHGEVRLDISCEDSATGYQITARVSDTGPGIADDVLTRLFKPFSQADASIAQQFGGTGLGLAITRNLAKLMQGDVSVQTTPGEGSCFTLSFHAGMATNLDTVELVDDPAELAASDAFASLRGLKLLLVEDNFINRQVATAFLSHLGGEITDAENGQEALDRLAEERFDLVLMDVRMPVMNGLEATRAIRAGQTSWSQIPVLALTANATEDDVKACFEAGMNGHVSKPLAPISLFKGMRRVMSPTPEPTS